MRIFLSALVIALAFAAAPARADMASAQQAYANGDFLRALQLWQEEANAGNADAAVYLGNMYVDGIGISEPDPELAAVYYQMAVDQNHAEAQASLGLLYLQGAGVEQSYPRAAQLLYEAAEQGHPVAQVELANLFLVGVPEQVERVPGHAHEWYSLAAGRGVMFAQMRLGQMYWDGIGAEQNTHQALYWMAIAYHLSQNDDEPYWSYRVFPLDAGFGDPEEGMGTLRAAIATLYAEYRAAVPEEDAQLADDRALSWIAERF